MNIIEEVLSACISSARAEPMKLIQGKKSYDLHTQLSVMMTMPSGSFKSTILKSLPEKAIVKAQDYSLPAMVGSIGKNGVVKGYIMKAAGKCLVVDEFHSLGSKAMKALLSITEDQSATRVFGFKCNSTEKKSGKYLKYNICDNELHINYVRSSVLLSGIFAPHKRGRSGVDDFAFSSRFLPVTLKPTFEEIDDIVTGTKEIFNVKYVPYKEAPVFEDWNKFVNCYREVVNSMKEKNPKIYAFFCQNSEFYTRTRGGISRVFSWVNRRNSVVEDWEKYIPYIPFFLYSCVASTLTHSEYEIYSYVNEGKSQVEIANMLGCSKQYVSNIYSKLKGVGLG